MSKFFKVYYSGLLIALPGLWYLSFSLFTDRSSLTGGVERKLTQYVEDHFATCTPIRTKEFQMSFGKLTRKHLLCGTIGLQFIYQKDRLDQATVINLPEAKADTAASHLLQLALADSNGCEPGRTRNSKLIRGVDYDCDAHTIRFIRGRFRDGLFASVEYK